MNTNTSADDLLNHQHRWMRVGWPLAAANIGLFLTLVALWAMHPSFAQLSKWGSMPVWWTAGVAGSFAFALLFLLLRRRPVAHSARQLDARLDARNRLETAAALGATADPIARAQRHETTEFLRRAPVKTRHLHLRLLAAGLGLAIVIHLFTFMTWTRPWQAAAVPVAKAPPPPSVPKGVITWKSPKAESSAVPIEEVPLAAVADSTSGLKDMTLEISVNGEARQSVKVPVEALDKAGKHPVAASIYLDQLNVEPFDMVSYYLRAQRIAPGNLAATASQVQFVEVKPFRDDIQHLPSGAAGGLKPMKELASLTALKLAQLRLVKENFFLTHADLDHGDSVWSSENQRVGSEQNVLDTKTSETVDLMTQDGAPAEVVDLLNQARPFMTGASAKILAKQNDPALPLQGKSLALITAVEKYIHKVIADAAAAQARSGLKDPFEKKRELEMKQRSATQAGELELLAKEQERLAHDLAKDAQQTRQEQQAQPNQPSQEQTKPGQDDPGAQASKPDPNRIEGSPTERQTQISQRIGALLNGATLDPAVTQHLENGHNEAGEALKQLDAGDDVKAQEPAAGAAHELRLAESEMNKLGEEKARDELSNAVMLLDQAAEQARTAPEQKTDADAQGNAQKAGDNVTQAKANLADAAKEQQEIGSEKAAARLADFAKMLNDDLLRADMQKLHDQPRDKAQAEAVATKLGAIADQIAMQPGGIGHTPDEIARLIERAERSKANLEHLAAMERAADTEHEQTGPERAEQQRRSLAGQVFDDIRQETADAQTVLPPDSTITLRNSLSANLGGLGSGQVTRGFGKIDAPLASMIALLRVEMQRAQRQYELTDQTMAKAPAAYREAVADYFERLSRDFEKQGVPAAPAPPSASAAPAQSPAP